MQTPNEQPRAVALISGGLDSMLAAKVVQQQGVYVEGVNFYTGFCVEGHTQAIRGRKKDKVKRHSALWSAEQIGIPLQIEDISEDYKDVVINPSHGYGRLLNPCTDCKIFMVNRALELTSADGKPFDFVITGEVVGQRPKSQLTQTMELVAKEAGAEDLLLRPLSAKHFTPTLPERNGWVNREQLYDFAGRSRKPQMQLAAELGITEWSQPAGGCCFLTDESFSRKLKDLWDSRGKKEYELEDVLLLKVGRHIRPAPHFKLIIGRDAGENQFLNGLKYKFEHMATVSHVGPLCLLDGETSPTERQFAARILARYSKGQRESSVTVQYTNARGVSEELTVNPVEPHEIRREWTLAV